MAARRRFCRGPSGLLGYRDPLAAEAEEVEEMEEVEVMEEEVMHL